MKRPAGVRGGTAAAVAATSLGVLPDEAIIRCLALLPQGERYCVAALVNKRFHGLCHSPELLHTLEVEIRGVQALFRTRQLLHLLTVHGPLVRRLELWIEPSDDLAPQHVIELQALIAGCLVALGAAGRLEALTILPDTPLCTTAWLPALSSLRELQLGSESKPLFLPAGLPKLTALVDATLTGSMLLCASLPTSLTRLHIQDGTRTAPPEQLSRLANLHHLAIEASYHSGSLEALSTLHRLRHLDLRREAHLPSCLAALTQLDTLEVAAVMGEEELPILHAALRDLLQLTCLVLNTEALPCIPPAVAGLSRLQRCLLWTANTPEVDGATYRLPAGPWLASLRWLGLSWAAALQSIDVLAAAGQLEYLCILDVLGDMAAAAAEFDRWAPFWRFAATHPPLLRLGVEVEMDITPSLQLHVDLLDALLDLKHRRPALLVRRTMRGLPCVSFWGELVD